MCLFGSYTGLDTRQIHNLRLKGEKILQTLKKFDQYGLIFKSEKIIRSKLFLSQIMMHVENKMINTLYMNLYENLTFSHILYKHFQKHYSYT